MSRLKTCVPAVSQVWRYRDDDIGACGPCYRIESLIEFGAVCTPGLWSDDRKCLEPLSDRELERVPLRDLGRVYEYIGDEVRSLPNPSQIDMPIARLSFEPMLDRLTVATERIADALEKMARPTLHEAVAALAADAGPASEETR